MTGHTRVADIQNKVRALFLSTALLSGKCHRAVLQMRLLLLAPPTLHPPLPVLDYSFLTQSHPGSAKDRAEPFPVKLHRSRLY